MAVIQRYKRLLVVLVLLAGCAAPNQPTIPNQPLPPQPSIIAPTPSPNTPTSDEAAVLQAQREGQLRDPVTLAQQWGIISDTAPLPTFAPANIGDTTLFWIKDINSGESQQVQATLQVQSPHLDVYSTADVNWQTSELQAAIDQFEQRGWALLAQWFPAEALPRQKVTVLNAAIPDVGGYYASDNEFPTSLNPTSNQREIIFINAGAIRFNTDQYPAVLIHEMQHLLQRNVGVQTEAWFNEGASMLSEQRTGWGSDELAQAFIREPDTQLNQWANSSQAARPHYGAAELFLRYMDEQLNQQLAVGELARINADDDLEQWTHLLQARYPDVRDVADVFAVWATANLLNNPTLGDGRYGYRGLPAPITPTPATTPLSATVHQLGADYVSWTPSNQQRQITWRGDSTVNLINAPQQAQPVWWSGRGDNRVATLTTKLHVPDAAASLSYQIWYDLEADYDYAFVSVSTNGTTWQSIQTTASTSNDSLLGSAITGASRGWRTESLDLSQWRGQTIDVRFWSITDDAFSADGLALADVQFNGMPITAWQSAGFVPIRNQIAQTWRLRGVLYPPDGVPIVEDIAVDAAGNATWMIPANSSAVLIIAATTWQTTQIAHYMLEIAP